MSIAVALVALVGALALDLVVDLFAAKAMSVIWALFVVQGIPGAPAIGVWPFFGVLAIYSILRLDNTSVRKGMEAKSPDTALVLKTYAFRAFIIAMALGMAHVAQCARDVTIQTRPSPTTETP